MADPHTDDELRERFQSAFGRPDDAAPALASLRPGMVRARRRHRVRAGVTTTVASLLMATGVGAMASSGTDPAEPRPDVATSPAEPVVITAPTTTEQPTATAPPSTATDSTTTTTIASPTSSVVSAPAGTGRPPSADPAPTPSTSAPTPTPTDPLPTPAPPPTTSAAPPITEAPTTTVAIDPTTATMESECGSVVVAVDGNDVNLVSVHPAAQMLPDIKNDGPEKVEVSFEGPGGHCELEAEVHDGQLVTEIDNE